MGMLRSKQVGSSKYFTMEEMKETVTKNIYNSKAARVVRPEYTFKSKAKYNG